MEDTAKKNRIKKFLEWMGVHLHLHPKFYTVLAVAVGWFLALFTGLFFYRMSPSFCNRGHIMSNGISCQGKN